MWVGNRVAILAKTMTFLMYEYCEIAGLFKMRGTQVAHQVQIAVFFFTISYLH